MSKRETKLFLEDILDCVRKIESYTNKLSFDDFTTFAMVVDAVVRNLEIIGEASKNIPKEIQNQSTEIPWQNIIGLRNRIIHEYFGVDLTIIWLIIKEELPLLKLQIENLLKN